MSIAPEPAGLLLHLAAQDREATLAHCTSLLREGLSLGSLVDGCLAPAMVQVGALWEAAVWTEADEHQATAMVEGGLAAAAPLAAAEDAAVRAWLAADGDGAQAPVADQEILVASVGGDWHGLASQMVAEVVRSHGWRVCYLGPSSPTEELVRRAAQQRPACILLSCSLPTALPELVRAVARLSELAIPVYVGGAALGTDGRRAAGLGAAGWAADARGAAELVRLRPTVPPGRVVEPVFRLRLHAARLDRVHAWVDTAVGAAVGAPVDPAELTWLAEVACVALLLEDEDLLYEQLDWLRRVLTARGSARGHRTAVERLLTACSTTDRVLLDVTSLLSSTLLLLELDVVG